MGRRGESIFKRKDGRWEARYRKNRTPEGKLLYGFVYAKTYKEVKLKRELKIRELESVQTIANTIAYQDLLNNWLILIRPTISESTYQCYKRHIKNHINPFLGAIKIDELTRLKIMDFIHIKLSNGRLDGTGGLSSKTVIELLNLIKMSVQFAVSLDLMDSVDLKFKFHNKRRLPKILTNEEQAMILRAIDREITPVGIAIILALYCGLRIGEICAVRIEDIDFLKREIRINKTLYRIQQDNIPKTKIVIAKAKTDKGNRIIPIPKKIIKFLKKGHSENSVFLISNNGKPFEPRVLSFQFKSVIKNAGVRPINFHLLRHTFASRCIELGFDYNVLSEILGHSKPSTTMNLYVHTANINKHKFMDKLDFYF